MKKRIKLEERIDRLEKFVREYPVIWAGRIKNIFSDWNELEELHIMINLKNNEIDPIAKMRYYELIDNISSKCDLPVTVEFETLKKLREELSFCEESFEYISRRNYQKALPKEVIARLEKLNIGGAFGSERDRIRKKYNLTKNQVLYIISKYGSIDNFREIYIQYLVDLHVGKCPKKPDVGELDKFLVTSFDIASPDLIGRRTGVHLLVEDILGIKYFFVDSDMLKMQIEKCLSTLSSRTQEVVKIYYGIDTEGSLSFPQMAKKLNLSSERVRQIRDAALKKLKEPKNLRLIQEAFCQNNLEPQQLEMLIRTFFMNHDVFYDFNNYDLDEQARNRLLSIYENHMILKKEQLLKNKQEIKLRDIKDKKNKKKNEVFEEILSKLTLYDLGLSIKSCDYIVNMTILEWLRVNHQIADEEVNQEICRKVSEFQEHARKVIEENLDEELVNYDKEDVKRINLSVRANNIFENNEIYTIGDLIRLSTKDILKFKNLGKKTYKEIIEKVHSLGLSFSDETENEKDEKYKITCDKEKIWGEIGVGQISIEELGLSHRPYEILKQHLINTVETLVKVPISVLKKFKGLGESSWQEIEYKVHSLGYKFCCENEIDNKVESKDGLTVRVFDKVNEDLELEITIQELKNAYRILNEKIKELETIMNEIIYIVNDKVKQLAPNEKEKQLEVLVKIKQECLGLTEERERLKDQLKGFDIDF